MLPLLLPRVRTAVSACEELRRVGVLHPIYSATCPVLDPRCRILAISMYEAQRARLLGTLLHSQRLDSKAKAVLETLLLAIPRS
jgi:hypothetical protein